MESDERQKETGNGVAVSIIGGKTELEAPSSPVSNLEPFRSKIDKSINFVSIACGRFSKNN